MASLWTKDIFGLVILLLLSAGGMILVRGDFNIVMLHTNDVHARVEQTNKYSANCSESDVTEQKCYGGVARRLTAIEKVRREHENVVLLDAGDEFQGTVWFPYYDGLEASHFMNRLGYDAMCTGNHEFDNGAEGFLSPFLRNASFHVLACNIDLSSYPQLRQHIQSFAILDVGGEQVGVIGYITKDTATLVDPSRISMIEFLDIEPCVQESVKNLQDLGVNKIIAVGHSGYSSGKLVAAIPGVDIVVEGHSNTFLYNGEPPSNEKASGPYPTVVSQPEGGKGLVYSAYAYGKYLGMAQITFDDEGNVKNWSGNPILLDKTYEQDADLLEEMEAWREPLEEHTQLQIGETYVTLQGGTPHCRVQECNLGNLFTDAILYKHLRPAEEPSWTDVRIVLWNGGGIRATVPKGPITTGNILEILPFRNVIYMIWISGATLRRVLEHSASGIDPESPPGHFLQMSGVRVVYNMTKPEGSRVDDVMVICVTCDVPKYEALNDVTTYSVLTNSFLINGGDGYSMLRDNIIKQEPIGTLATDALEYYINKTSPVFPAMEGRIRFLEGADPDCSRTFISGSSAFLSAYHIRTVLITACVLVFLY